MPTPKPTASPEKMPTASEFAKEFRRLKSMPEWWDSLTDEDRAAVTDAAKTVYHHLKDPTLGSARVVTATPVGGQREQPGIMDQGAQLLFEGAKGVGAGLGQPLSLPFTIAGAVDEYAGRAAGALGFPGVQKTLTRGGKLNSLLSRSIRDKFQETFPASVPGISDVNTPADAAKFALYTAGQSAPLMLTAVGGGNAAAATGGRIAQVLSKTNAGSKLVSLLAGKGEQVAAFFGSLATMGYPAVRQAVIERNMDETGRIEPGAPLVELGLAVPYTAVEVLMGLTPQKLNAMFAGRSMSTRAVGKWILENLYGEGKEEVLQEAMDIGAPILADAESGKKDWGQATVDWIDAILSPEGAQRIVNAFAGGAAAGALLGAGGTIIEKSARKKKLDQIREVRRAQAEQLAALRLADQANQEINSDPAKKAETDQALAEETAALEAMAKEEEVSQPGPTQPPAIPQVAPTSPQVPPGTTQPAPLPTLWGPRPEVAQGTPTLAQQMTQPSAAPVAPPAQGNPAAILDQLEQFDARQTPVTVEADFTEPPAPATPEPPAIVPPAEDAPKPTKAPPPAPPTDQADIAYRAATILQHAVETKDPEAVRAFSQFDDQTRDQAARILQEEGIVVAGRAVRRRLAKDAMDSTQAIREGNQAPRKQEKGPRIKPVPRNKREPYQPVKPAVPKTFQELGLGTVEKPTPRPNPGVTLLPPAPPKKPAGPGLTVTGAEGKGKIPEVTPTNVVPRRLAQLHSEAIGRDGSKNELFVDYASVSPELADEVKRKIGVDVSGFRHVLDESAVRHVDSEHGPGKEKDPNQVPVVADDFSKLPEVVESPDSVEDGGLTDSGLNTVRLTKRINGHIFVVEEVRTGRKKLAIKTIYKKKAGGSSVGEGGPQPTSETVLPRKQAPRATTDKNLGSAQNMPPADPEVKKDSRPSVDHSTLSPSGKVSKRSAEAAKERARVALFGKDGLQEPQGPAAEPEPVRLRRVAKELEDVADRGLKPKANRKEAARLRAEADRLEATKASRSAALGKKAEAITPTDRRIPVQFAVVEADSLITSDQAGYLADLQPRDRSKVASRSQIEGIGANPIAEKLVTDHVDADIGTPVVGPDMMVEGGNGRTMGLRLAYDNGNAEGYRQRLMDEAGRFGLDPEAIGRMKRPVLVRIRQGDLAPDARRQIAKELNQDSKLKMTAQERAGSDVDAVRELISHFQPGADGNIFGTANYPFLQKFFAKIQAKGDEGAFIGEDGGITKEGKQRVFNALFAAAYKDPKLVALFTDDADPNVKTILNALLEAMPSQVIVRQGAEAGTLFDLDISQNIAEAVRKLAALRADGMTVDGYFAQGQLFDDGMSALGKDLLLVFDHFKRSAAKVAKILNDFNQRVISLGNPKQGTLETKSVPTRAEVLLAVVKLNEGTKNVQTSLFESPAGSGKTAHGPLASALQARRGAILNPAEVAIWAAQGLETQFRKGVELARSGLTTFTAWGRRMLSEFGQGIRAVLKGLYRAAVQAAKAINQRLGRRGAVIIPRLSPKATIEKSTGVRKPPSPKANITEKQALKRELSEEERAARVAAAQGRKVARQAIKFVSGQVAQGWRERLASVVDEAKEKNRIEVGIRILISRMLKEALPITDRAAFIRSLTGAKTPNDLGRVAERIFARANQVRRRDLHRALRRELRPSELKNIRDVDENGRPLKKYLADMLAGVTTVDPVSVSRVLRHWIEQNTRQEFADQASRRIDAMLVEVGKVLEGTKKTLDQLSIDELQMLLDAVRLTKHASRMADKIQGARHEAEIIKTAGEMMAFAQANPSNFEAARDAGMVRRAVGAILDAGSQLVSNLHFGMKELSEYLGDVGKVWFYEEFMMGNERASSLKSQEVDRVNAALEKHGMRLQSPKVFNWLAQLVQVKIGGKTFKVSRGERLGLIGMAVDPQNAAHAARYGLKFRETSPNTGKIRLGEIAVPGGLNAAERDLLAAVLQSYNQGMKDAMNDVTLKTQGRAVATRDGTFYPREVNRKENPPKFLDGYSSWESTNLDNIGVIKERITHQHNIVVSDILRLWHKRLDQVSRFYGFAIPLRNADAIMHAPGRKWGDPGFQDVLNSSFGNSLVSSLNSRLVAITGTDQADPGFMDRAYRSLAAKISAGTLGVNPSSILKQYGGIFSLTMALGKADVVAGVRRVFDGAERAKIRDLMRKWSPSLRDRYDGVVLRLLTPIEDNPGSVEMMARVGDLSNKMLAAMQEADMHVAMVAWAAAERQVKRERPDLTGDDLLKEVGFRTFKAVEETQNPTSLVMQSGLSIDARKSIWTKMFGAFKSAGARIVSNIVGSVNEFRRGRITGRQLIDRLAWGLAGNTLITASVSALSRSLFKALAGDDDDDDENGSLFRAAVEAAAGDIASLPYGSEYLETSWKVVATGLGGQPFRPRIGETFVSSALENAAMGVHTLLKAIRQVQQDEREERGLQKGMPKANDTLAKAVRYLGRGAPMLMIPGYPSRVAASLMQRWLRNPKVSAEVKDFARENPDPSMMDIRSKFEDLEDRGVITPFDDPKERRKALADFRALVKKWFIRQERTSSHE